MCRLGCGLLEWLPRRLDSTSRRTTAATYHRRRRRCRPRRPTIDDQRPRRQRSPVPLTYVFPFTGKKVSYGHRITTIRPRDVFGCGADVVAPVGGTIDETRTIDPWVPKVNDPATRGGKYVSMVGDDGVRYYFAHLALRCRAAWRCVEAGDPLGVMGQTGNARKSACHTHFGISWPCPQRSGRCVAVRSGRGSTSTTGEMANSCHRSTRSITARGGESRRVQPCGPRSPAPTPTPSGPTAASAAVLQWRRGHVSTTEGEHR